MATRSRQLLTDSSLIRIVDHLRLPVKGQGPRPTESQLSAAHVAAKTLRVTLAREYELVGKRLEEDIDDEDDEWEESEEEEEFDDESDQEREQRRAARLANPSRVKMSALAQDRGDTLNRSTFLKVGELQAVPKVVLPTLLQYGLEHRQQIGTTYIRLLCSLTLPIQRGSNSITDQWDVLHTIRNSFATDQFFSFLIELVAPIASHRARGSPLSYHDTILIDSVLTLISNLLKDVPQAVEPLISVMCRAHTVEFLLLLLHQNDAIRNDIAVQQEKLIHAKNAIRHQREVEERALNAQQHHPASATPRRPSATDDSMEDPSSASGAMTPHTDLLHHRGASSSPSSTIASSNVTAASKVMSEEELSRLVRESRLASDNEDLDITISDADGLEVMSTPAPSLGGTASVEGSLLAPGETQLESDKRETSAMSGASTGMLGVPRATPGTPVPHRTPSKTPQKVFPTPPRSPGTPGREREPLISQRSPSRAAELLRELVATPARSAFGASKSPAGEQTTPHSKKGTPRSAAFSGTPRSQRISATAGATSGAPPLPQVDLGVKDDEGSVPLQLTSTLPGEQPPLDQPFTGSAAGVEEPVREEGAQEEDEGEVVSSAASEVEKEEEEEILSSEDEGEGVAFDALEDDDWKATALRTAQDSDPRAADQLDAIYRWNWMLLESLTLIFRSLSTDQLALLTDVSEDRIDRAIEQKTKKAFSEAVREDSKWRHQAKLQAGPAGSGALLVKRAPPRLANPVGGGVENTGGPNMIGPTGEVGGLGGGNVSHHDPQQPQFEPNRTLVSAAAKTLSKSTKSELEVAEALDEQKKGRFNKKLLSKPLTISTMPLVTQRSLAQLYKAFLNAGFAALSEMTWPELRRKILEAQETVDAAAPRRQNDEGGPLLPDFTSTQLGDVMNYLTLSTKMLFFTRHVLGAFLQSKQQALKLQEAEYRRQWEEYESRLKVYEESQHDNNAEDDEDFMPLFEGDRPTVERPQPPVAPEQAQMSVFSSVSMTGDGSEHQLLGALMTHWQGVANLMTLEHFDSGFALLSCVLIHRELAKWYDSAPVMLYLTELLLLLRHMAQGDITADRTVTTAANAVVLALLDRQNNLKTVFQAVGKVTATGAPHPVVEATVRLLHATLSLIKLVSYNNIVSTSEQNKIDMDLLYMKLTSQKNIHLLRFALRDWRRNGNETNLALGEIMASMLERRYHTVFFNIHFMVLMSDILRYCHPAEVAAEESELSELSSSSYFASTARTGFVTLYRTVDAIVKDFFTPTAEHIRSSTHVEDFREEVGARCVRSLFLLSASDYSFLQTGVDPELAQEREAELQLADEEQNARMARIEEKRAEKERKREEKLQKREEKEHQREATRAAREEKKEAKERKKSKKNRKRHRRHGNAEEGEEQFVEEGHQEGEGDDYYYYYPEGDLGATQQDPSADPTQAPQGYYYYYTAEDGQTYAYVDPNFAGEGAVEGGGGATSVTATDMNDMSLEELAALAAAATAEDDAGGSALSFPDKAAEMGSTALDIGPTLVVTSEGGPLGRDEEEDEDAPKGKRQRLEAEEAVEGTTYGAPLQEE